MTTKNDYDKICLLPNCIFFSSMGKYFDKKCFLSFLIPLMGVCVATIEGCIFCASFMGALFILKLKGEKMKKIKKKKDPNKLSFKTVIKDCAYAIKMVVSTSPIAS